MGAPWFQRHPQTNLLEFVVVEQSWQETSTTRWEEVKKQALDNLPQEAETVGKDPAKDPAKEAATGGRPSRRRKRGRTPRRRR